MTSSPFLALPAGPFNPNPTHSVSSSISNAPTELRNSIYASILADSELNPVQRLTPFFRGRYAASPKWSDEHLLPLAHVCRQLRAEFLPLWVAGLEAGVKLTEVERFVEVFGRALESETDIVGDGDDVEDVVCPKSLTVYIDADADASPIDLVTV
jgi:hypothetical protein